MTALTVAFRVDANADIGTGHWMRCRTLALALQAHGAQAAFISREPPPALAGELEPHRIPLLRLPPAPDRRRPEAGSPPHAAWLAEAPERDAELTAHRVATRFGVADCLIVDHYGIDARWHRIARRSCRTLMAIDDLADRSLDVDLVLDQAYREDGRDYLPWLQAPAEVLPGIRHALLRPEYRRLRDEALSRRAHAAGMRRVLVSFGGVDAANHTETALSVLDAATAPLQIDVVLGAAAAHRQAVLRHAARHRHPVSVSEAVSDMAVRMMQADLAFGACGFTAWERCCLGLPSIAIAAADNQLAAAQALRAAGAALIVAGDRPAETGMAEAWRQLSEDSARRRALTRAAAAACDGRGSERTVRKLLERQALAR